MPSDHSATEELLRRAERGDAAAVERLLTIHRQRLKRMVAVRLDPRLAARLDASDVVQDALMDASRKLPEYLRTRPVPFYPWLRRLAWEKVVDVQRRHVDARRRSVEREEARLAALPDHSSVQLAERLLAGGLSPAESLVRRERLARVRTALGRLPDTYHEVLVLRYLEQLDTLETAAVLGVSEGVVKGRHRRALERLQLELDPTEDGWTMLEPTAALEPTDALAPALAAGSNAALDDLLDEISARLGRGEAVDVEEYAARHPQCAERLRKVFPAMQALAQLGRADGEASSAGNGANGSAGDNPLAGVLGDFRILRQVGRGGMGVVYEAEQISLGRRVALKVLPFASMLDPRSLARFRNEALAVAQLDHPHIVDVIGVGSDRGVRFYAMRFVDGRSLAEVIEALRQLAERGDDTPLSSISDVPHPVADSPGATAVSAVPNAASPGPGDTALPAVPNPASIETKPESRAKTRRTRRPRRPAAYYRSIAELGAAVAEALDHAHEQGVIHGDVKPSNLMLDGRGKVWVTDFGLARIEADTAMTMTGDLLGTLRYMSPEQAMAKRIVVDHRTDIYSLGASLYELLTLRPAFDGESREEILRQIAFEEPTPPRRHDPGIPDELETILLKALEKNPADRYPTAADLADDLRRFLAEQPVRAKRPGVRMRAKKWLRRHPTWTLATESDPHARDPQWAVELAGRCVALAPNEPGVRNTLGVALYRAGDWSAAVAALDRSRRMTGGSAHDFYFLAMAHRRLGQPAAARTWYLEGIAWMEANASHDPEFIRFRAEAEALLGLPQTLPLREDVQWWDPPPAEGDALPRREDVTAAR